MKRAITSTFFYLLKCRLEVHVIKAQYFLKGTTSEMVSPLAMLPNGMCFRKIMSVLVPLSVTRAPNFRHLAHGLFYSSKCFAVLDVIFDVLFKYTQNDIRNSAEYFLDKYLSPSDICCSTHNSSSRKWLCRFVSNIYINDNQKISNSEIRKDDVRRFKARQTEKRKVL